MKISEKIKATQLKARWTQKYQVVRDEDGSWAVVTHLGFVRPCVTWELAMGSMPGKKVAA